MVVDGGAVAPVGADQREARAPRGELLVGAVLHGALAPVVGSRGEQLGALARELGGQARILGIDPEHGADRKLPGEERRGLAARVASLAQPPHRPLLGAGRGEPGASSKGTTARVAPFPGAGRKKGTTSVAPVSLARLRSSRRTRGVARGSTYMEASGQTTTSAPAPAALRVSSPRSRTRSRAERSQLPRLEAAQHPTVLFNRVVARLDRGHRHPGPGRRRLARPGGDEHGRERQGRGNERREDPAPHQGQGQPVVDRDDRERQRPRAAECGQRGRGLAGLGEEEGPPEPPGVKVGTGEVEGRPGERRHGDRGDRGRPCPETGTRPRARRSGSPTARLPPAESPPARLPSTGLPPISTGIAGSPHCPSARPKGSAGTSSSSR